MKTLKIAKGILIPDKYGNRMLIDRVHLCDQDGKKIRDLSIKESYEILMDEETFIIVNPKFEKDV